MCLFLDSITPLKAEEDIICYKVLTLYDDNVYYSPYRNFAYENAENIIGNSFSPEEDAQIHFDDFMNLYALNGGAIYTYPSFWRCERNAKDLNVHNIVFKNPHVVSNDIFECIIPKGTEYWNHKFKEEIAAREIKIVRKINIDEK